MKRFFITSVLIPVLFVPSSVFAFNEKPLPVKISNGTETSSTFNIPTANAAGGLSVAVADLGDDGIAELIVGNGLSNEPRVRVLRADGSEIGSFLAYDKSMGIGIHVTTCDIDGDGYQEIITSPQHGGGPHIRIFSRFGKAVDNGGFFAYPNGMNTGINIACGNLDNALGDELITLPEAGGGPHVKIWKKNINSGSMEMVNEFFDGSIDDTRGRVATVNDLQLVIFTQRGTESIKSIYNIQNGVQRIEQKNITLPSVGINSVFYHNGHLLVAGASDSVIFDVTADNSLLFETPFGSLIAASGKITNKDFDDLVVVPARPLLKDEIDLKHIIVDLSEQRLYAYEKGLLENTFLVSTAKAPYETPLGEHSVLAKLPYVHYRWSYGANNPNNYDLGEIPYNLRIYPHIYIHYAPWHNNFGQPMSHGCINVNLENIKWVYSWADEGIPVTVQE